MRIVGLEGVHHFQLDGGVGNSCNMVVELVGGQQFRVPITREPYEMLSELGNYSKTMTEPSDGNASPKQKLEQPVESSGQGSLQEFANNFITEPNQGNQMALAKELVDISEAEAEALVHDPVSQLRKVGMFGEPQDILKTLSTARPNNGPDVVESFEDTSDQYEEDDPGEENSSIAEQF